MSQKNKEKLGTSMTKVVLMTKRSSGTRMQKSNQVSRNKKSTDQDINSKDITAVRTAKAKNSCSEVRPVTEHRPMFFQLEEEPDCCWSIQYLYQYRHQIIISKGNCDCVCLILILVIFEAEVKYYSYECVFTKTNNFQTYSFHLRSWLI